jgi:hypothetical protein
MQEEVTEHQTKVKKEKVASASKSFQKLFQDQISSRLMRGMMVTRKKCFVKRLDYLDQIAWLGY